jgi:two-component system, NtrC family, response regulator AtoC
VHEDDGEPQFEDSTAPIDDVLVGAPLAVLVFGPDGPVSHPLHGKDIVKVGRALDADLRIDDASVSRKHATLLLTPHLAITDEGSQNGVRIKNRLIAPHRRHPIGIGEPVMLGGVALVVYGTGVPYPRPGQTPSELGGVTLRPPPLPPPLPPQAPTPRADLPLVFDPAMRAIYALVERVAPSELNVLVLGETGVGKELIAEAIHRRSRRAAGPLVKLNTGALAPSLVESELFGHERGAFTGADREKIGLLETARGGTVFLDEVGEVPIAIQAKLLRVIEDKHVLRVGGREPRPIDCRFIAATNRNLEDEVRHGSFRKDLFFRLCGVSIHIPPLRERPSEVEHLARLFASRTSAGSVIWSDEVTHALLRYQWPGNIRELRNVIERAAVLAQGGPIRPEHIGAELRGPSSPDTTLTGLSSLPPVRSDIETLERRRILDALSLCSGNQTRAAKLLGISRRTLINRLDAYRIPRPRKP